MNVENEVQPKENYTGHLGHVTIARRNGDDTDQRNEGRDGTMEKPAMH